VGDFKLPAAVSREAARLGSERGIGFYPLYPLHPCSIFLFARTIFSGFGKAAIAVLRRRRLFAGMEGIKGIKAAAAE
jgi:hypothetical protein